MGNRQISGTKPHYDTWLDQSRTLSQRLAEDELEGKDYKGAGVLKLKKSRKKKDKKFVSCLDCIEWVTTDVVNDVPVGHCKVGITRCIH